MARARSSASACRSRSYASRRRANVARRRGGPGAPWRDRTRSEDDTHPRPSRRCTGELPRARQASTAAQAHGWSGSAESGVQRRPDELADAGLPGRTRARHVQHADRMVTHEAAQPGAGQVAIQVPREMQVGPPETRANSSVVSEPPVSVSDTVKITVPSESRTFHSVRCSQRSVGVSVRRYCSGTAPSSALRPRGHHPPCSSPRSMAQSSAARSAPV